MEKSDEQDHTLHHISHLHPLHLITINDQQQQQQQQSLFCHACRLECSAGSAAYCCAPCRYFLHPSCATLPSTLRHAAHPAHPLALLLTPTYQNCSFTCDACRRSSNAFSFHCSHCQFDLHLPCAAMPESVSHSSHPHPVILTYQYPGGFVVICDLCNEVVESDVWFYICKECDFGGHVGCFAPEMPAKEFYLGSDQNNRRQAANSILSQQQQVMARLIAADTSAAGARAAADLAGGYSSYYYGYGIPPPSYYSGLVMAMTMQNMALMNLNNGLGGEGDGGAQNRANSNVDQDHLRSKEIQPNDGSNSKSILYNK